MPPRFEAAPALSKAAGRARTASIAIAVGCGLHLVSTVAAAIGLRGSGALSLLALLVGGASGVAFLAWVSVAHAAALVVRPGFRGLVSPAAAVRAYLVPVWNLVAPLDDMERLRVMSDPRDVPVPSACPPMDANAAYRDNARLPANVDERWRIPRAPIAAWWMTLLATLAVGGATQWISRAPAGLVVTWEVLYVALHLATGWLSVAVMRAITELQRERARRLEAFARA